MCPSLSNSSMSQAHGYEGDKQQTRCSPVWGTDRHSPAGEVTLCHEFTDETFVIRRQHMTKEPLGDDEGREGFPEHRQASERLAGQVPDHRSDVSTETKPDVILLLMEGLAFNL